MKTFRAVACIIISIVMLAKSPPSRADFPFANLFNTSKPHTTHKPLHTDYSKLNPVERVAARIDELEYHIDTYGTVVAKQPDIWGQARLTKHRQEYERELAKRFDEAKFNAGIQGTLRRSDQSFLAHALSLNGMMQKTETTGNTVITTPQQPVTNQAVALLPTPTAGGATTVTGQTVKLERFDTGGSNVISLEPVVEVDQLSRYLNHLNQLRRINEGDDTADSPGYSLNLVRIPVSVLPGARTKKGFGAEITITAEHHLTADLLPITFRNMVVNDIVDHLAPAITHVLNDQAAQKELLVFEKLENERLTKDARKAQIDTLSTVVMGLDEAKTSLCLDCIKNNFPNDVVPQELTLDNFKGLLEKANPGEIANFERQLRTMDLALSHTLDNQSEIISEEISAASEPQRQANATQAQITVQIARQFALSIPATRTRRASHPIPPSQLGMVYGDDHFLYLTLSILRSLERTKLVLADGLYHYGDVAGVLRDEIDAVYELLWTADSLTTVPTPATTPTAAHMPLSMQLPEGLPTPESTDTLWSKYCTLKLVQAIRLRNGVARAMVAPIKKQREHFLNEPVFEAFQTELPPPAEGYAAGTEPEVIIDLKAETTKTLAWGIVAVSALLNERLMQDMDEVSRAKDCACAVQSGDWLDCYSRNPSPTAIETFNEYVRCRWPIHVFAMDPVTQDQNIADVFSVRRELQLSVAVAVATGEMSASNALRFTRNLEQEMETISLNRTVVSFSHGTDTFGWRFHPRFQTFPTVNNLRAFGQTIWGGPTTKAQTHELELEAGMRECTAIVIMPSFVPHVRFHTRSNWFSLNHPRDKQLTLQDTVALSHTYQVAHAEFEQLCHTQGYRPQDISQLYRVITQLDRRMPLQNMLSEVPHENSIGGFELFNNGITDFVPELTTWYGAPGINPTGQDVCKKESCDNAGTDLSGKQCAGTCCGTTLFLIGQGFSVHETQVIAGGRCVPFTLLSRQTMRVTIPAHVNSIKVEEGRYVDVHIATPYGVSNHLLIPVNIEKPAATPKTETPKSFSFVGRLNDAELKRSGGKATLTFDAQKLQLEIKNETGQYLHRDESGAIVFRLTAKANDKKVQFLVPGATFDALETRMFDLMLNENRQVLLFNPNGDPQPLETAIKDLIERFPPEIGNDSFTLTVAGFVRYDTRNVTEVTNTLEIKVRPPKPMNAAAGQNENGAASPNGNLGLRRLPNIRVPQELRSVPAKAVFAEVDDARFRSQQLRP